MHPCRSRAVPQLLSMAGAREPRLGNVALAELTTRADAGDVHRSAPRECFAGAAIVGGDRAGTPAAPTRPPAHPTSWNTFTATLPLHAYARRQKRAFAAREEAVRGKRRLTRGHRYRPSMGNSGWPPTAVVGRGGSEVL